MNTRYLPAALFFCLLCIGLLGGCMSEGEDDKGRVLDLEISGKSDSLLTMDSLHVVVFSKDSSDSQVVLKGKLRDKNQLMGIPLDPKIGDEIKVSIKGYKGGKLAVLKEVAVDRNNAFVVTDRPIRPDSTPIIDTLAPKPQPQLEVPADTMIREGENLLLAVKVLKAMDPVLDIKGRDLPRGSLLRMNGRYEAEFSWKPDFDQFQDAPYAVTFTTTAGGLALEKTLRVRVLNVNRPPVLAPIRNYRAKENERVSFPVLASDPDGNAGFSITAAPLPRGASFVLDTFTWVPEFNQEGTYYITFKASDGELTDSQAVAITVGDFNRPPDLDVSDTTISENEVLTLWISAKDPDGKRLSVRMENAPQGATLAVEDSGAGKWRFSWKPHYSQGRPLPYEVTFIAKDDSLETRKVSKIIVKHVNRPPTANAGRDTTVTINDLIGLNGSGTDSDDPMAKWEWDCGGTGAFVRVQRPDTQVKAPATATAVYKCILRATDSEGATAVDTLVVKVTDESPTAKTAPDTTADPFSDFRLRGTASDDGRLVEAGWACDGSGTISPTLSGREATFRLTATDDTLYRCVFRVKDDDGRTAADTLNIKVKLNWVKAADSAGFPGRTGAATVVFRDRMWVIGGRGVESTYLMDIWSSADGKTWRLETDRAECLPRMNHTVLVHEGKLWLIGGSAPIGSSIFHSQSDVWSSFDGVSWTRIRDSAGFTPRENHAAVVFGNKMWILGGEDTRRTAKSLGDAWYSEDGATWTLGNASAFSPRAWHKAVVHDHRIWVVGGWEKSDILTSRDGLTWTTHEVQKPFYPPDHFFQVVAHGGRVWAWADNQVWQSTDLSNWVESTSSAPYVGRQQPIVFGGKLWTFGIAPHPIWYHQPN